MFIKYKKAVSKMKNYIQFRQDVLCMEYNRCLERSIYLDGQANKGVDNIFLALGVMAAVLSIVFTNIDKENLNLLFILIVFGCVIINFLMILAFFFLLLSSFILT